MNDLAKWKLVLAWGCLGLFFAFPILMPLLQFLRGNHSTFASDFRYLGEYMRTVAAIIISLAGFSTVEIFRKTNSNNK